MPRTELFLGNLGRDISRSDIEKTFDKYGRLIRCDLKNRGFGANFAFLEFEDERDAEDALRAENGKDLYGSSLVVEWAKSKGDRRDRDRGGDRYGGRDRYGDRGGRDRGRGGECYECGERGHFARDCRYRRGSGRNRVDRDRSRDRGSRRSRDRRDSRSHSRHSRHSREKRDSRSYSRSPSRGHSKHSKHSKRDSRSPVGRDSKSPISKRSRTRSPKRRASRSPRGRDSRSPKNGRTDQSQSPKNNGHASRSHSPNGRASRSPSYGKDRTNGHSNGHSNGSVKMDNSDHE